MDKQWIERSERDETLAAGLYTGVAAATAPIINLAHFGYSIRRRPLLDSVASTFGSKLCQQLSPEHIALLAQDEEQLPEDIALAARMRNVQRETLMR